MRIDHDFVDVAPPTRTCITVVDETAHTATELVEESKPVGADAYVRLTSVIGSRLAGARALVMSGTLAPDAPVDFYARCAALAGANLPTIVDATGEALLAAVERRLFLAKPNRAELGQTLEADVDDESSLRGAMRELCNRGARWVVVTDGARPTFVCQGRDFWRIDVPQIEPVSPIGCGDAMAAGIAVGIVRGMPVPQACRFGSACAVAKAMTPFAGHVDNVAVERASLR